MQSLQNNHFKEIVMKIDVQKTLYDITGFIQGSLSKIQGLFKDFSRLFYSFQRLKVEEKY